MKRKRQTEDDEANLLSFLDLLTCSMIGMMVLSIILAVAMATGGSLFIQPTNPVAQPVLSAIPQGANEDPLFAVVDIYIANVSESGSTPTLSKWSANSGDSNESSGSVTVSASRAMPRVKTNDPIPLHTSFLIRGDEAVSSSRLSVTLDDMPGWTWGELGSGRVPAQVDSRLQKLGLDWVYAMNRNAPRGYSKMDVDSRAEWAMSLRRGGLKPSHDVKTLWIRALAWNVIGEAYRRAAGIDEQSAPDEKLAFVDLWRYEPLKAFLDELAGLAAVNSDLQPQKIPMALVNVRTNSSYHTSVWVPISRKQAGPNGSTGTVQVDVSSSSSRVSFK
ncbi:hypothetical protein [Roseiconus lacunae]|uniref:Uncharacterized protein n=1 Tax=Roseiconus lacunae TaxID=2605694 RepID=A0ABT7PNX5_9BACT|nr:hypothetical protein [Roseiconus lacunae]MDM4018210.1 hypothetical protein [Roseiconus lacunae]